MSVRVAVVGTGIMGLRMVAEMKRHPSFESVWPRDENATVRAITATEFPELDFVEEIFTKPAALFYIATPPTALPASASSP